jgi:MFS family permease
MAETEDADDLAIVFRSAGKLVRMSSATKWRRAIALGDLTRATPVEVEIGRQAQGVRLAGELAALKPIFNEYSPEPAPAPAETAPDPAPERSEPAAPLADAPLGEADAAAITGSPPGVRQLLRERSYMFFWTSRWLGSLAAQAQAVTIALQVYQIARATNDVRHAAFAVGMIGLAQFAPLFLLAITAGGMADKHDRRLISAVCMGLETVSVAALIIMSLTGVKALWPIYVVAVGFGASRAFLSPSNTALAPMLVPRELLPRAIAWNSLAWQSASILGPALGGLLCGIWPQHPSHGVQASYGVSLGLYIVATLCLLRIRGQTRPLAQVGSRWALAKEGLVYVWTNKIVFGAISLDLFAVLLGGATALLPVFALDVLHVGASGFGILRAGPAIGAVIMGVILALRPIRRKAGLYMFGGVAVFGAATLVFALSKSLAWSVVALAILGAADMISVYVRQTLVQLVTPDHMRGRVAAVSGLFIGASNELGEFESGVAARFLGPIGAAVFGGVGALIVTGLWARWFPDLRKADRLG